MGGMKVFGEYGYNTLSNYFTGAEKGAQQLASPVVPAAAKKAGLDGVVSDSTLFFNIQLIFITIILYFFLMGGMGNEIRLLFMI